VKITVEVPIANRDGKHLKLHYDVDAGEVRIESPVMLATPVVRLAALQDAVGDLQAARRGDL
jgi:hypothetical protein